jgi:hypothetical protein
LHAKVTDLDQHADVDDLRKYLVKQQKLTVGPARLSVFEHEGAEKPNVSKKLKDYFAPQSGFAPAQRYGSAGDVPTAVAAAAAAKW